LGGGGMCGHFFPFLIALLCNESLIYFTLPAALALGVEFRQFHVQLAGWQFFCKAAN